MSPKITAIAWCCLGMLALSACKASLTEGDEISGNMERARPIIQALERYEQDHGGFPQRLDLLVPAYLSDIPHTITHQNFTYRPSQYEGYYLVFDVVSTQHLGCRYIQRLKDWDCSLGGE